MYSLKYMYVKKFDNPENTWKIHAHDVFLPMEDILFSLMNYNKLF